MPNNGSLVSQCIGLCVKFCNAGVVLNPAVVTMETSLMRNIEENLLIKIYFPSKRLAFSSFCYCQNQVCHAATVHVELLPILRIKFFCKF